MTEVISEEITPESFGTCELRTYRLALAATGEYTAFHGGSAANAIAVGNPAKVVKYLDPDRKITTREQWLSNPGKLAREFDKMDRHQLNGNTVVGWLRSFFTPKQGD